MGGREGPQGLILVGRARWGVAGASGPDPSVQGVAGAPGPSPGGWGQVERPVPGLGGGSTGANRAQKPTLHHSSGPRGQKFDTTAPGYWA